jgi:hypothetical protein
MITRPVLARLAGALAVAALVLGLPQLSGLI